MLELIITLNYDPIITKDWINSYSYQYKGFTPNKRQINTDILGNYYDGGCGDWSYSITKDASEMYLKEEKISYLTFQLKTQWGRSRTPPFYFGFANCFAIRKSHNINHSKHPSITNKKIQIPSKIGYIKTNHIQQPINKKLKNCS